LVLLFQAWFFIQQCGESVSRALWWPAFYYFDMENGCAVEWHRQKRRRSIFYPEQYREQSEQKP
jgi:hypothetical protein